MTTSFLDSLHTFNISLIVSTHITSVYHNTKKFLAEVPTILKTPLHPTVDLRYSIPRAGSTVPLPREEERDTKNLEPLNGFCT